jgi:hypothetical protein
MRTRGVAEPVVKCKRCKGRLEPRESKRYEHGPGYVHKDGCPGRG